MTRPALACLALASALLSAPAARAEDAVQPAASIGADLHGYYVGERNSAYIIGGVGLVAAGTGSALVTQSTDLARGMGWALASLGGLELLGSIFYAVQVAGEIDHYEALLARDPQAFAREELAHIEGTTSRFIGYRLFELALTLGGAGAAVYGVASHHDAWTGAGVGVAAVALPLFVLDSVNQGRAVDYRERVRAFRPSVGAGSAGPGSWMLTLGARF